LGSSDRPRRTTREAVERPARHGGLQDVRELCHVVRRASLERADEVPRDAGEPRPLVSELPDVVLAHVRETGVHHPAEHPRLDRLARGDDRDLAGVAADARARGGRALPDAREVVEHGLLRTIAHGCTNLSRSPRVDARRRHAGNRIPSAR
jgi:hypothetical protein